MIFNEENNKMRGGAWVVGGGTSLFVPITPPILHWLSTPHPTDIPHTTPSPSPDVLLKLTQISLHFINNESKNNVIFCRSYSRSNPLPGSQIADTCDSVWLFKTFLGCLAVWIGAFTHRRKSGLVFVYLFELVCVCVCMGMCVYVCVWVCVCVPGCLSEMISNCHGCCLAVSSTKSKKIIPWHCAISPKRW